MWWAARVAWRRSSACAAVGAAVALCGALSQCHQALNLGDCSSQAAAPPPRQEASATVSVPAPVSAADQSASSTCTNIMDTVGNTPLLELRSLSAATGCRILAKAEYRNPGGSVKDRPARYLIEAAEREGRLIPANRSAGRDAEGVVIESTGGNTGIAVALMAAARGYECIFTMPNNISPEKIAAMRTMGAEVHAVPVVPFSDRGHYVHLAQRIEAECLRRGGRCVWLNQFDNLANARSHFETTAPEIWRQAGERVDAVVASAGTGGTIAGLSRFFKSVNPNVKVFLIDPAGSALLSYVKTGEFVATPGKTVSEGIGQSRLTRNIAHAQVDDAMFGSDEELVAMAYYLLRREGVFVGPSAALNVVGAVKAARALGPGHTIVTVLCDGGEKYFKTLYNVEAMLASGHRAALDVDTTRDHADFVQ